MNRARLYVVVATSGASVLAVEILGTRILGPFYGVGLYLWSALISVTLAALSLGYALGGRWADRGPTGSRLALILAAAGIWLLAVPWVRHPLLAAAEDWGLRAAVLVTAFLLFFPPLALLGMVSPYAVRLRASRLEEVGRAAGDVYAVSTVASLAAAILTGFWLIPNVGVTRLTLAVGIALLLAALVALRMGRQAKVCPGTAMVLILAVAGGAWMISTADSVEGEGLRFVGQSPYAEIRVLDRQGLRYFLIDGGVHTLVEAESLRPRQPYVIAAELAKEFYDRPGEMLLVGLGGGACARSFARDGWNVDAVEIDPVVTRVARRHFGLDPGHAEVHHMDGRRYLRVRDKKYDFILLDAFGSSSIPFHLVTVEVFGLMRSRLDNGGVLAVNLESLGWNDILVASLAATLERCFQRVVALPTAEPPDRVGNVVLFASDRDLQISDQALGNPVDHLADVYDHWRVVQRNHAWDNRFEPDLAGVPVLTDDLNPVDTWSDAVNLAARKRLHDFFGSDARSW